LIPVSARLTEPCSRWPKRLSAAHHLDELFGDDRGAIRWSEMAVQGIAGMEIRPFVQSLRRISWYDAWDMASGVIWQQSHVLSWRLVARRRDDGRYDWLPQPMGAYGGA
jgi:hypothetical protein